MERRQLLVGLGSAALASALASPSWGQSDAVAAALLDLVNDVDAIDDAHGARERFERVEGDPAGAQGAAWRRASQNPIAPSARELIIACEVSSQATYEVRYQPPIRPGGQSGVTIGIGYDLGYASEAQLRAQWSGRVSEETIAALVPVCGLKGAAAQAALPSVRHLRVTWAQAISQFDHFLPYAVGKTEDTFPNSAELPPACLGALVSLVYNRGPSLSPTSPRRREMREIAQLTMARNLTPIPTKIRDMKRLWQNDPSMRGLLARREVEALMFEQGLAS
jgi:hypothetical protein